MMKSATKTARLQARMFYTAAIESGTLAECNCALEQADAAAVKLPATVIDQMAGLIKAATIRQAVLAAR